MGPFENKVDAAISSKYSGKESTLFKGKLIYLQNITLHNSDILNIINDNGENNPGSSI